MVNQKNNKGIDNRGIDVSLTKGLESSIETVGKRIRLIEEEVERGGFDLNGPIKIGLFRSLNRTYLTYLSLIEDAGNYDNEKVKIVKESYRNVRKKLR